MCGRAPVERLEVYKQSQVSWLQRRRARSHNPRLRVQLPPLASDEALAEWRRHIADSALHYARVCDVPYSLLPKSGAMVLG